MVPMLCAVLKPLYSLAVRHLGHLSNQYETLICYNLSVRSSLHSYLQLPTKIRAMWSTVSVLGKGYSYGEGNKLAVIDRG
jgi:hypothetical protein